MESADSKKDFSTISPTAKLTAYYKSFSDIPYAKEIAETVHAEETAKRITVTAPAAMVACSSAIFEMRYKAINYGIRRCNSNNVLELACGLSTRGLEVIANGGVYVGTDLAEMSSESSSIVLAIARRAGLPIQNLYLQSADVMHENELKSAVTHFASDTFVVCNEGLLQYFTMEEKARMAQNIRGILYGTHGYWITTDILYRKEIHEKLLELFKSEEKNTVEEMLHDFKNRTNITTPDNEFTDKDSARTFYSDLGFTIEEFPMYAKDYVPSTLSLVPDRFQEGLLRIFASASTWILTAKP